MLVIKPAFVSHTERSAIFSVDVHPDGTRFATGGADHKVRIWNMAVLLNSKAESDPSVPRSLAVLSSHFGSVNCVRWSPGGRIIASGSDDRMINLHERRAGKGTVEFGSREQADVENWKLSITLRGHISDVVDLAWSPDGAYIVSCGLDCSVRVWQLDNGAQIAALEGHKSMVKGVAWDPIDSFIASQSDDKSVRVWRTRDWTPVAAVEGCFEKTIGATFFRRLDWSPCGTFLTTTHAFAAPQHTAAVIDRSDWSKCYDFVGHGAPVVVVRYNQSMFRRLLPLQKESQNGSHAKKQISTDFDGSLQESREASEKAEGHILEKTGSVAGQQGERREQGGPYNCIAIGSQDCRVTVWVTDRAKPVLVGKHFFQQPIVDLVWSPDGYSLLCCSTDGSVAVFNFTSAELGIPLTAKEMDDIKCERYGRVRGRQVAIAESAALMALEQAARRQSSALASSAAETLKPVQTLKPPLTPQVQSSAEAAPPAAAAAAVVVVERHNEGSVKNVSGGDVQAGGEGATAAARALSSVPSTVIRQIETRRPDGRRRIIPQPVGGVGGDVAGPAVGVSAAERRAGEGVSDRPFSGSLAQSSEQPEAVNLAGQKRASEAAGPVDGAEAENGEANGAVKRLKVGEGGEDGRGRESAVSGSARESAPQKHQTLVFGGTASLREKDVVQVASGEAHMRGKTISVVVREEGQSPLVLEARPGDASSGPSLRCTQAGSLLWKDALPAPAAAITGTLCFWAAGLEDGSLQVYTRGGRRALPKICMSSPAAMLANDGGWRLLAVTRHGEVQLWDLQMGACVLRESAIPLLTSSSFGGAEGQVLHVTSARITASGAPLLVLKSGNAFVFHAAMKAWLCLAHNSFPLSEFTSCRPSPSGGELAELQAGLVQGRADGRLFAKTAASFLASGVEEEKEQTRDHLEDQIASAAALKSGPEYRQWLLAYVRHLTREADEQRLREVCEELLGPPGGGEAMGWQPVKLGVDKRKLLREDVLPAMSRNFSIQRLANEFLDLLTDMEETDTVG